MTFLDQGISSVTNFGGSALAAGLLNETDFGAFAVSVSVLILFVGIARAWSGNALLIIGPDKDDFTFKRMLEGSAATSLVIGLIGASTALVGSVVVDGATKTALLALAACIPVVTLQDSYRLGSLVRRSPAEACLNDGLWLVGVVVGLMILRRLDEASLWGAVLAANGTAAFGLAIAVRRSGVLPRVRELRPWLRMSTPISLRLCGDFVLAVSYGLVPLVLLMAWNADLEQAGALRGAQVLMGPLAVVFAASTLYTQPVMVVEHRSGREIGRFARSQSMTNAALAGLWILIAAMIPDQIGIRVFGASWEGASDLVIVVGLAFIGLAISTGPLTALRSRGQLNANLITQLLVATTVLLSSAIGGLLLDEGLLLGFAFGNIAGGVISWVALSRWQVHDMIGQRK